MPLGPEPGLFLEGPAPVDPARLFELLGQGGTDMDTGVTTNLDEVFGGLRLWLGLHEPGIAGLAAQDAAAERGSVPYLAAFGGEHRMVLTVFLANAGGLAALARPPQDAVRFVDMVDIQSEFAEPFSLLVRRFGPDPAPAQRMLALVQGWDRAGRPSSAGLRIRAYPRDAQYSPAAGEQVLEQRSTRFVLDWPGK